MSTATGVDDTPHAIPVTVTDAAITAHLAGGHTIDVPFARS